MARLTAESIIDAFPHIIPSACLERFNAVASGPALEFLRGLQSRPYLNPMWDLDARFRSMDDVEGYVQVLTLCLPPIEQIASGRLAVDLAQLANDRMAELVARYPDRFVGFAASLPMQDADASLVELNRTVVELGALGVQVFTNVNGRAVDDVRYDALWARLQELDRTVWVHGARSYVTQDYTGEQWSRYGLWAALGWPYEMGMFAGRMVGSGVLDRYPRLRFYLHHSGGMVPTFSRRVNGSWLELQALAPEDQSDYGSLRRPVGDYFRDFYADTSGQTPVAIRAALEFFGSDHVLLGSDAPFGRLPDHMAILASLHQPPQEYAQLVGANARHTLRLE
jgi:predicted TIM-barrel fold metal-dependent hydrolase